jgi:hypothetical protein
MRPVRGRFLADVRPAGYRLGPLRSGAVSPPSRLHRMLVAPAARPTMVRSSPSTAGRCRSVRIRTARTTGASCLGRPMPDDGEKAARSDDPSDAACCKGRPSHATAHPPMSLPLRRDQISWSVIRSAPQLRPQSSHAASAPGSAVRPTQFPIHRRGSPRFGRPTSNPSSTEMHR